jgi:hypothetical protein
MRALECARERETNRKTAAGSTGLLQPERERD